MESCRCSSDPFEGGLSRDSSRFEGRCDGCSDAQGGDTGAICFECNWAPRTTGQECWAPVPALRSVSECAKWSSGIRALHGIQDFSVG